ncbi:MAG: hypothetical protein ACLGHX_05625 [Acidimicrobiia bacterium]
MALSSSPFGRSLLAALATTSLLAACGDEPLQGLGQRSGEWIGPLAEQVVILPGESTPP